MGEKIRYVETDVNGFFLIDQLEFGTYYVAAEHEEEGYGDSFVFRLCTRIRRDAHFMLLSEER